MKRKTTEEFISEALSIHKDYDYTDTVYINSKTKVKIKCKKCNIVFEQQPKHHLNGHGCSYCAGNKKSTLPDFINKANGVHNNKYTYNNATYKNTDTKILITCKIHGDFLQTPYHHLQGKGCPNCANNTSYTNDEFIAKANTIHHDTYDYSKSVYKNNSTKVTIICKSHGEFQQTPQHHFRGQGCPKCNK